MGQRGEGLLCGKATQVSTSKPSRKDKSPQSCMQDKGMSGLRTLGSGQRTLTGLRQALESSPEGFTPGCVRLCEMLEEVISLPALDVLPSISIPLPASLRLRSQTPPPHTWFWNVLFLPPDLSLKLIWDPAETGKPRGDRAPWFPWVTVACLHETSSHLSQGQSITDVQTPKCSAAPLQTCPWENILELRARAALNTELLNPRSRAGPQPLVRWHLDLDFTKRIAWLYAKLVSSLFDIWHEEAIQSISHFKVF